MAGKLLFSAQLVYTPVKIDCKRKGGIWADIIVKSDRPVLSVNATYIIKIGSLESANVAPLRHLSQRARREKPLSGS